MDGASTLCTTMLGGLILDYPANVSNAFAQNTYTTDCTQALGQACVDAIQANASLGVKNNTCVQPGHWWTFPECASTFGYLNKVRGNQLEMNTFSWDLNIAPTGLNFSNPIVEPEGAPWTNGAMLSGSYAGSSDTTASERYYSLINQPQVLLLSAPLPRGDGTFVFASQLLCTRVNQTKLVTDHDEDGDGITSTTEAANSVSGSVRMAVNPVLLVAVTVVIALLAV